MTDPTHTAARKPRPPENLSDDHNEPYRDSSSCVTYRLSFSAPQDYLPNDLSYTVNVWIHERGRVTYKDYNCSTEKGIYDPHRGLFDRTGNVDIPVELYADNHVDYVVVMRVAVMFRGVLSEYRYFTTKDGGCEVPVTLSE